MKIFRYHRQWQIADVSQNVSQVIHRFEGDTTSAGGSVNLQRVVFSQRLIDGRNSAADTRGGLQGARHFANDALETLQVRPLGSVLCSFFAALYPLAARGIYLSPAENLKRGLAE